MTFTETVAADAPVSRFVIVAGDFYTEKSRRPCCYQCRCWYYSDAVLATIVPMVFSYIALGSDQDVTLLDTPQHSPIQCRSRLLFLGEWRYPHLLSGTCSQYVSNTAIWDWNWVVLLWNSIWKYLETLGFRGSGLVNHLRHVSFASH